MERLISSLNVRSVLVTSAIGLFCFVVMVIYKGFDIRQRTIKLRKEGLVK